MAQAFAHLILIEVARGKAKLTGRGSTPDIVRDNKANRTRHASGIRTKLNDVTNYWKGVRSSRKAANLPPIPGGFPFLVQIPEKDEELLYRLEKDYGVTVVAQYEEGFLMVATEDLSLAAFQSLVTDFENEVHGSATMASILDVFDDQNSPRRLNEILTPELLGVWPLVDNNVYILDVSVQTAGLGAAVPEPPELRKNETPEAFARRNQAWQQQWMATQIEWDDKQVEVEQDLQRFIEAYSGEVLSQVGDGPTLSGGVVTLPDSFSVRIRMRGQGFTDLLKNYARIFEADLPDDIEQPDPLPLVTRPGAYSSVEAPGAEAPAVCVIDSGIQENHRLLQPAIDGASSRSFLPSSDAADRVCPHGHGTPVAGAILYRSFNDGPSEPACCWIQNARLLDDQANLPQQIFPALALREIIRHYRSGSKQTRLFNHSIAANGAYRVSRMSTWAAAIDLLSHEHDVLVIQPAGNISGSTKSHQRPGIVEHISSGRDYPAYLREGSARISNPGQSLQALTVGSVAIQELDQGHRKTIAKGSYPSSFTRSGWGLWNTIKPEVVEFGGDFLLDNSQPLTSTCEEICPELVRSTFNTPGAATVKACVGTSFAAPRVSAIAARLQSLFPTQSTLLYRALIIQSARWPEWMEALHPEEKKEWMRSIGYGIPDISRASENTEQRVTLITAETQKVHPLEAAIYSVEIPAEFRSPGSDFDVRIDITLSYSTNPRRTRSSRKGYQEVWLDWIASNKGESLEDFKRRALKGLGEAESSDSVEWTLHQRSDWGILKGIHRQAGTVQKDWVVFKAYELPETLAIAVRGHHGWSRNPRSEAKFVLAVTIEAKETQVPIYTRIQQEQEVRSAEIESQRSALITEQVLNIS